MDQQGFLLKEMRMCPLWLHKLVLIARYRLHLFVSSKYNSEQRRLDLNLLYILKAAVFAHKLVLLTMHCWISQFLLFLFLQGYSHPAIVRGIQPCSFLFLYTLCFWKEFLTARLLACARCLSVQRETPLLLLQAFFCSNNRTKWKSKQKNDPLPPVEATYLAFIRWTILFCHCFLRSLFLLRRFWWHSSKMELDWIRKVIFSVSIQTEPLAIQTLV